MQPPRNAPLISRRGHSGCTTPPTTAIARCSVTGPAQVGSGHTGGTWTGCMPVPTCACATAADRRHVRLGRTLPGAALLVRHVDKRGSILVDARGHQPVLCCARSDGAAARGQHVCRRAPTCAAFETRIPRIAHVALAANSVQGSMLVDVSAMSKRHPHDQEHVVGDGVDDAVVAHSYSVPRTTTQGS